MNIATVLKNLPKLHDVEFDVTFSFHVNTFFQKLIGRTLLEKGDKERAVRIEADDYFRGLMFLDYFGRVVQADYEVCDYLVELSKKIREKEKEAEKENGVSYLPLDIVIDVAGLVANQKGNYSSRRVARDIKARYEQGPAIDLVKASQPDPYYEAIGQMVADQAKQYKNHLEFCTSREELCAVVFTDIVMERLEELKARAAVEEALVKHDYLSASIAAVEGLRKEVTPSQLEGRVLQILEGI